jgi:prepilin-type N-terminal cleavage/methylation domain-containing protein
MKQIMHKGFTLVELLIVIALIAILSVAVLSTINPIEQTNKARDSKFKNDAAEVLNAVERYYASVQRYPWTDVYPDTETAYVADGTEGISFVSVDPRFGIMGNEIADNTYEEDGPLIKTSELKGVFAGKEEFATTVTSGTADAMYIFHSADANYVCFCPKASANRTGASASELKCLAGVSTVAGAYSDATLIDVDGVNCTAPTESEASGSDFCAVDDGDTYANLMCVPEGSIQ